MSSNAESLQGSEVQGNENSPQGKEGKDRKNGE